MTLQEHIEAHKALHKSLDILVADFIQCTNNMPSTSTVLELLEWSHKQTIHPTNANTKEPHKEGET